MEMRESEVLSPPVLQKKIRDLLKNNPELTLAVSINIVKKFTFKRQTMIKYNVTMILMDIASIIAWKIDDMYCMFLKDRNVLTARVVKF